MAQPGPASVIVVTLVLAYFTLVFGELAPKRVAMHEAGAVGSLMARPLALLSKLTRPIVWMLSHSTDIAVRVMGGDPNVQRDEVTEEELRDMVAVSHFTPEQRQIIDGAFEIAERTLARDPGAPRDVVVVDAQWSCHAKHSHGWRRQVRSRAPVADGGSLDHVNGVVHLRQLLGTDDAPATTVAMEIPMFPETAKALRRAPSAADTAACSSPWSSMNTVAQQES